MRKTPDPVSLFETLERTPFAVDFLQAMRRIECAFPTAPRWATARRPQDEPIRLGQEPALSFAPASLSAFIPASEGRPPRLEVRFLGLLGPNGPLPLHLTEYARERLLHHDDPTFARFLDLIHHRFLTLFYRAWAQAQPTVSLDRPSDDRFSVYIGTMIGMGEPTLRHRDQVPDNARLFHAGLLARQVRNAESLHSILSNDFGLKVEVEQYAGHWMPLRSRDHGRIGQRRLGVDAVIGRRVWDRQSKFRLHIGPMSLAQYQTFLPGGSALPRLTDWIRFYTHGELAWDARMRLQAREVPHLELGRGARLGWTSWLGRRRKPTDADDFVLDGERLIKRHNRHAPAPAG